MAQGEFPWKKARRGLPSAASSTEPICLADMQALGHQKLDLIERENPAYELAMSQLLKDTLASKSSKRVDKAEVRAWLTSLLD